MRNRLIFPDGSPYSPGQRARIRDVWAEPPIGIRVTQSGEFPDLMINPIYSGGVRGKDVRYVSFSPSGEGKSYELTVEDSGDMGHTKLNPKIVVDEIFLELGKFVTKKSGKPVERFSLVTKVTPDRGAMTHRAIIDLNPNSFSGRLDGVLWRSEKLKENRDYERINMGSWNFF